MLLENSQNEPASQQWRQLFIMFLCVAGAFVAKIFIHWSSAAVAESIQQPDAAPATSVQVEQGAPGRRF